MIKSPYPDQAIPSQSVFDFLFSDLASEDEGRGALVDGSGGQAITFGQLKSQIELLAGALAARGLGAGDIVAIHCPNIPAFAVVFHGILRAAATATTINVLYTAEEIETQLKDSGAKALFTLTRFAEHAREAAANAGIPPANVIHIDGDDEHSLRALLAEGREAP